MTELPAKMTEKALRLRKRMKQRKPNFVRPESWRYVRLKENWRRPRGLDHKVRLQYDGWPPGVNVGYRGPKPTRGFHPSGQLEVLVHNVDELKKVDPKTHVARIAHTVGKRKRGLIFAEARKRKITVLNIKQEKERELPEAAVEEKETEEEKEAEKEAEEAEEEEKPKRRRRRTKKTEEESGK